MRRILVAAWCGAALALLLVPVANDYRAVWRAKLQDFSHVPLFLVVAAGLIRCFAAKPRWAFLVAVGLALVGELCQRALGRSASVADLLRGAVGAAVAVLWFGRPWTKKRAVGDLPGCKDYRSALPSAAGTVGQSVAPSPRKRASLALGGILLAVPIVQVMPALLDAAVAWWRFPILADFQTPWEPVRWHGGGPAPTGIVRRYLAAERRWVGEWTIVPDAAGSAGAILFPVVGDWSGFARFSLAVTIVEDEPLDLSVSIRDGIKLPPTARRFETRHRLEPGRHELRIDLAALARGDNFAPVDITRVQSLHLVVHDVRHPRALRLEHLHLE